MTHAQVIAHLEAGKQRRTDALLAHATRHPKKEWNWLHGILCASHGMVKSCDDPGYDQAREDRELIDAIFDGQRIAARLDKLNRQALEDYNRSKEAA